MLFYRHFCDDVDADHDDDDDDDDGVCFSTGNIDQAQYCDKIKGIVDFLGSRLSVDELAMIWKIQVWGFWYLFH